MWSDKEYYYSDSSFQLELNLQSVRRSLIQMIEDFEAEDCNRCRQLKCRCEETELTPPQSTSSKSEDELKAPSSQFEDELEAPSSQSEDELKAPSSQSKDKHKAPPASDLPRPEFKNSNETIETNEPPAKDVESWVRTSTPNPNKTVSPGCKPLAKLVDNSWPPAPKSIWNDYKIKLNTSEINTATVTQAPNVQEFFKSFSFNMYCSGSKNLLARNRALMQQLQFLANKPAEYTYF